MRHHLFLSPHFDDVVGSCGGAIVRLVTNGHAVHILTVFGGDEREPFSVPAQVLHDLWKLERPVSHRRLEDASACRLLGCESTSLPFADAIYRQDADGRHLYPTFSSLRGAIAPDDRLLAERLAAELGEHLSNKNTVVYCPLAIGTHVDHTLTRDCGRLLATTGSAVVFYRDFAYDRAWNGRVDDFELNRVDVTLTSVELGKKITAFSEYKSQIADLFGSRDAMVSYFAETGSYESLFLPQPATGSPPAVLWSALMPGAAL